MNNPEAFKEDEVRSIKFVVPGLPFGKQRPKVTVRKFTGSDGKEKKFAKAYTPEKTVNYVFFFVLPEVFFFGFAVGSAVFLTSIVICPFLALC